jgi:hypothetical protein
MLESQRLQLESWFTTNGKMLLAKDTKKIALDAFKKAFPDIEDWYNRAVSLKTSSTFGKSEALPKAKSSSAPRSFPEKLKTMFNALPDEDSEPDVDSTELGSIYFAIESYDFGNFRDGFVLDRYKTIIYNLLKKEYSLKGDDFRTFARFLQIWGIKLNLYGIRIKPDNYINFNGKKFTALDLRNFLKLPANAQEKDTPFEQLTMNRFVRVYSQVSLEYALKTNVDPGLRQQVKIPKLPVHCHFLNCIYTSESTNFRRELMELSKEFDRIIRSQGVQLKVPSYEARAIYTLYGPDKFHEVIDSLEKRLAYLKPKIDSLRKKFTEAPDDQAEQLILSEIELMESEMKLTEGRYKQLNGKVKKPKNKNP